MELTDVLPSFTPYIAVIRNAFLSMLAYRLRYYTGILTYLLFVSVHYFIWTAVYSSHPPGTELNGFRLEEMVTYISVGWIARSLYFSSIDEEINELVRTGQISVYLLRPINFQLMMLAHASGESLFRLVFFTLPIGMVIVWAFPVSAPVSVTAAIAFLLASLLGFLIMAQVNFIVGLCAFYFKSIEGIMRAKYFLVQLLSGLLLPLSFFPQWIESALSLLPFKAIAYVPLQMYLGKADSTAIAPLLFSQIAWLLILTYFSHRFWLSAVKKLTLQGG